jgi:hypothetical protein
MNEESFKKLDQRFLKELEPAREAKVPAHLLKDFDARVVKRIGVTTGLPWGIGVGIPVLAVALALFCFAYFTFWQRPFTAKTPVKAVEPESEMLAEVEALKTLGVWTDEDDLALGIPLEQSFAELELAVPELPL